MKMQLNTFLPEVQVATSTFHLNLVLSLAVEHQQRSQVLCFSRCIRDWRWKHLRPSADLLFIFAGTDVVSCHPDIASQGMTRKPSTPICSNHLKSYYHIGKASLAGSSELLMCRSSSFEVDNLHAKVIDCVRLPSRWTG